MTELGTFMGTKWDYFWLMLLDRMRQAANAVATPEFKVENFTPASSEALRRLPVRALEESEGDVLCTICQAKLQPGHNVVALECHKNHVFHQHCIQQQLRITNRCPKCRQPIPDGLND